LVLVKYVLESILIYWFSITHVSKGILDKIKKKCFNVLWTGKKEKEGLTLAKRSKLARPKEARAWDLTNIYIFSQALTVKKLWRLLFLDGL
jgi:hypothetical protein